MDEKNPFEQLLDQIADLLTQITEGKLAGKTGEIPEDIEDQLDILENQVALMQKVNEEAMKLSGLESKEVTETVQSPEKLKGRDKKFVEKTGKLKTELVKLEEEYSAMRRASKLSEKKHGKGDKKKFGEKRKKKFRNMGGDGKGWMPL